MLKTLEQTGHVCVPIRLGDVALIGRDFDLVLSVAEVMLSLLLFCWHFGDTFSLATVVNFKMFSLVFQDHTDILWLSGQDLLGFPKLNPFFC